MALDLRNFSLELRIWGEATRDEAFQHKSYRLAFSWESLIKDFINGKISLDDIRNAFATVLPPGDLEKLVKLCADAKEFHAEKAKKRAE